MIDLINRCLSGVSGSELRNLPDANDLGVKVIKYRRYSTGREDGFDISFVYGGNIYSAFVPYSAIPDKRSYDAYHSSSPLEYMRKLPSFFATLIKYAKPQNKVCSVAQMAKMKPSTLKNAFDRFGETGMSY